LPAGLAFWLCGSGRLLKKIKIISKKYDGALREEYNAFLIEEDVADPLVIFS
jgi:hypothetical protein